MKIDLIVFLILDLIRIYPPINILKIIIVVGRPADAIVYLYLKMTVSILTLQLKWTRTPKKQEKAKGRALNMELFVVVNIILAVVVLMINYVIIFNARLRIPCRPRYYSGKKTSYQERKIWLEGLYRRNYPNYDLGFKIIIIIKTLLIYDIKTCFVKKIRQLIQFIFI